MAWEDGDFDGNGEVNMSDYMILERNFGVDTNGQSPSSIAISTDELRERLMAKNREDDGLLPCTALGAVLVSCLMLGFGLVGKRS